MRTWGFLLLFILVFIGVVAFGLHQRGLLKRENLDLFIEQQPEPEDEKKPYRQPVEFAASIQKEEQKLREEAEQLRQLAERLETQRRELDAERTALGKQLRELKAAVGPASEAEAAGIGKEMAKLVKMYEAMPPEEAAAVLENLPDATVARVLLHMRGRQAAQVMGSLNPNKAADVSKLLTSGEPGITMGVPQKTEVSG